jgi:hypothetical protein
MDFSSKIYGSFPIGNLRILSSLIIWCILLDYNWIMEFLSFNILVVKQIGSLKDFKVYLGKLLNSMMLEPILGTKSMLGRHWKLTRRTSLLFKVLNLKVELTINDFLFLLFPICIFIFYFYPNFTNLFVISNDFIINRSNLYKFMIISCYIVFNIQDFDFVNDMLFSNWL